MKAIYKISDICKTESVENWVFKIYLIPKVASLLQKFMILNFYLMFIQSKPYTNFHLHMPKHVGKSAENCVFPVFNVPKWAWLLEKLTQIDDNRNWSNK